MAAWNHEGCPPSGAWPHGLGDERRGRGSRASCPRGQLTRGGHAGIDPRRRTRVGFHGVTADLAERCRDLHKRWTCRCSSQSLPAEHAESRSSQDALESHRENISTRSSGGPVAGGREAAGSTAADRVAGCAARSLSASLPRGPPDLLTPERQAWMLYRPGFSGRTAFEGLGR